jgi:hypothetical protein
MNDKKELKKLCKFTPFIADLGPFGNNEEIKNLIKAKREMFNQRQKKQHEEERL